MKTKILIFLLLFIAASTVKTNASRSDTVWTVYQWSGYKVSVLGGDLHYFIKSKVKIEAEKLPYDIVFKFDFGTVEKGENNWFYFTPNEIGKGTLIVNDVSFPLEVYSLPDPVAYLDGDKYKWKDVITKDDLLNSKKIIAKNKYANFKVLSFTILFNENNILWVGKSKDSIFTNDILKHIQKAEVGEKFYIEDIKVKGPDGAIRWLSSLQYKVIDNYNDEFIRKTVSFKPYTYDLNLMKTDLRIKITGHPTKEDIKTVSDLANELNDILETIKVKIVDRQPSLTIIFDSLKNDSLLINNGYERIDEGYKLVRKKLFFPFHTSCVMYINSSKDFEYRAKGIKKDIVELLGEFKNNNVDGSIFNYSDSLSFFDKYMLKTLYSYGGEYKVQTIIDNKFDPPDRNDVFLIMLIFSVCLLFIFSEIYNYYGLNFLIGKIKFKIIRRIIESVLIAQIPAIAFLILLIEKFMIGDFHELNTCFYIDMFFVPFSILVGVLFLGLDYLLGKIKHNWIVTILNLFLSFFCIWLAYQIIYLFITPEIVNLSDVGWKIMLIPFIVTLYRLYARFQTNKISDLLQEKELELSKQKELKFKSDLNALQARINPHFLYNALNSLASLAYIDAGRTEKMALSLSKLFRYNINKEDEHFSSIKDEIEMTEIYLEIEKNRFEDKLEYNIEIQNSLYEFQIPKFILQPLAENAVKHGVSKITAKGIIKIKIFEQGQKVFIEIYDNGPEFPGGLISGYGLQNTYEKLKLLYKKSFEIEFINKPEKKLVIMLSK